MLAVDSGKRKLRKLQETVAETRYRNAETAKGETRAAGMARDVSNVERQKGRWMTATAFAEKLRRINPNVVMTPHPNPFKIPWNNDKAVLYLNLPDGTKEYLMVCEGDWMPEWSIMSTQRLRRPGQRPAEPWEWVDVPRREVKRGWRTVLIRLLHKGLVTLTDVEREFGSGWRESWQILTGKSRGELLI